MTRVCISALALAMGLTSALALAACGGEDDAKLLPGKTAEEITENLGSVRELASEGECVDAQDAALEVSAQVDGLEGIDPKLKQVLQEGAARLREVVGTCAEETTEETTESAPTTTEPEKEKPEKEKPEKEKPEKAAPPEKEPEEEEEPPKPEQEPPKGEGKGPEEEPAPETPSGGIGPGGEAEGD